MFCYIDVRSVRRGARAGAGPNRRRRILSHEQACGEWMRSAIPRAVAYARALLTGAARHQAEDVVQDVLCRLIAKPGRYDLPADGG
ncbi:MAG: hypothetical protein PHU85_18245, partial [Phycisphaerae bacterium]|nr:hypothetical protein [Phycisphaerae bacterium]